MRRKFVIQERVIVGLIVAAALAAPALAWQSSERRAPEGRGFEFMARQLYFTGVFRGDEEAFEKGQAMVNARLKEDPHDVEGLLWSGVYTTAEGVRAIRDGEGARGWRLWEEGFAAMERAVRKAPLDFGVRVGRGSRLMGAGLKEHVIFLTDKPDLRRQIIETGVADLELAHAIGETLWSVLGVHERGSLLLQLARGHAELGSVARAKRFASKCVEQCAGTRYEEGARRVLAALEGGEFDPPAAAQAGAPGGEGAEQAAGERQDPLEALFGHVIEDPAASALLQPAEMKKHLDQTLKALGRADGDPDAALKSFEKYARRQGGATWAWWGFASVMRSGRLFEAGRWQIAVPFWERGLEAIERGVKESNEGNEARFARGWLYTIVARHEPDRAASEAMRKKASGDLAAVAPALRSEGPSDALGATLAARAALARERGDMNAAQRWRREALEAVRSEGARSLVEALLDNERR